MSKLIMLNQLEVLRSIIMMRIKKKDVERDGEVAVRYTREQILGKFGEIDWYSCDETEAAKIELLIGRKATILTKNIFPARKIRKRSQELEEKKTKNEDKYDYWLNILGGLTSQTATILAGVHYNTANKYLQKRADLSSAYTRILLGETSGRGIKLYFQDQKLDNLSRHSILIYNAVIHFCYYGVNHKMAFPYNHKVALYAILWFTS